MKTILFLFSFWLIFFTSFAQKVFVEQNIHLDAEFSSQREVYSLVDDESGNVVLFLLDCDSIQVQEFNKDFAFLRSYQCARPTGKYRHLTGHSISNNQYHLYFSNKKRSDFLIKTIDIKRGVSSAKVIPLQLGKEECQGSVYHNSKLYVLFRNFNSSIYKMRIFNKAKLEKCIEYDLNEAFGQRTPQDVIADDLYDEPSPKLPSNFVKIENGNPNPLDLTSKTNKLYYINGHLIMSIDDFIDETLIIKLDLDNYTLSQNTYKHGNFKFGKNQKARSNSYIYNNSLFQLKLNRSELCFLIRDMDSGQQIKEFRVNKDESINFSNTPLIYKGKTAFRMKDRELKTKQLLRKLYGSRVGISAYQRNGQLQVKVGGVIPNEAANDAIASALSGLIGTMAYAILSQREVNNTTMISFLNYHSNKEILFTSLLNPENLEHIEGEPASNPFDKMKDFLSEKRPSKTTFTLFKMDDYYVLGYYLNDSERYVLRKFE